MELDPDRCYRAVHSRDPRFDGWFVTAVTSTGIYCRPSCPALTPKRANVRFYATAAAAQGSGFRACKRCRPDAAPGSPDADVRADLVGRALRLIGDGLVDREGVAGLARRLGYSERHVHRQLCTAVGAGPLALARAQRAHTSRLLLETTDVPVSAVALAAGFASIRQFNDTVQAVFARTPTELRRRAGGGATGAPGAVTLRLPHRQPCDVAGLLQYLGVRAVAGVEEYDGVTYRRALALPHGEGTVELSPGRSGVTSGRSGVTSGRSGVTSGRSGVTSGHVRCTLRLASLADLTAAVQRCRRLLDLDADPEAVVEALGPDPVIGPLVRRAPGRRVPGAVDGPEIAVRAVLGQQVSVAGARTVAGRLTAALGAPLVAPLGSVTHRFPSPDALAGADDEALPLPAGRRRALRALASAVAAGDLTLDAGADREQARADLVALPGIGPWTAEYVALRALGDPDAFPATDLHVLRALRGRGIPTAEVARAAGRWRPWRAYATVHLWSTTTEETAHAGPHHRSEPDRRPAAHA